LKTLSSSPGFLGSPQPHPKPSSIPSLGSDMMPEPPRL
jgi:hypothetical protein